MKKLMTLGVVSMVSVSLFAASRMWTDATGDHKWSTPGNWTPSQVPTGSDSANFESGDWTVELDGEDLVYDSIYLAEGSGTVTMTGSGKANDGVTSRGSLYLYAGRKLVIDGPELNLRGGSVYGELHIKSGHVINWNNFTLLGGVLRMTGGGFVCTAQDRTLMADDGGRVYMQGGESTLSRFTFTNDSQVVVSGGKLNLLTTWVGTTYFKFSDTCRFRLLGGELDFAKCQGAWEEDARELFLPGKGATLRYGTHYSIGLYNYNAYSNLVCDGSIFVTNMVAEYASWIYACNNTCFSRIGSLTAREFEFRNSGGASAKWPTLDLRRLNLGVGGFVFDKGSYDGVMSFVNGITFGAFADWGIVNANGKAGNALRVKSGPLGFDTLDVLDRTTVRTIALGRLYLNGADDLKATGGGTVMVTALDAPEQLHTIEVADGTTLVFTNGAAKLKTSVLKLGDNAKIALDFAAGDYLDVSCSATFGTGAKIEIRNIDSATLEAGRFYPVYLGPSAINASVDPDAIIDLVGTVPPGWRLGTIRNSVFLTDGTTLAGTAGTTALMAYWSGKGADNKRTTDDNWCNGTAPLASANTTNYTFSGTMNTVVDIPGDSRLNQMTVAEGAGPFVFYDKGWRFRQNGVALTDTSWGNYSVRNNSAFPVNFENAAGNGDTSKTSVFTFNLQAVNEGSIAILNKVWSNPSDLLFAGDIRVGGTYQFRGIAPQAYSKATTVRRNKLTILPGATVTTTNMAFEQRAACCYDVAKTASLTMNGPDEGGVIRFTGAENLHYVDGAWTINVPLGAPKKQAFRGEGTLTLAGIEADPEGLGGVEIQGTMTLVPCAWTSALALSARDTPTIAPAGDWTFNSGSSLKVDRDATLTLATGAGHAITLGDPLEGLGEVSVSGSGRIVFGAAGSSIWKLSVGEGVTVGFTDAYLSAARETRAPFLTVREPLDDGVTFGSDVKVRVQYDEDNDTFVYRASPVSGVLLIVR